MEPAFDPIGILLSLVLFSSIMAVLGWTVVLRTQRPSRNWFSRKPGRASAILVHVTASPAMAQAVELACNLAADQHARLVLAYVIEVPLSFALDAPLTDWEEKAHRALNSAVEKVKQRGLACESRIVPERTIAGGLARLARESHASALVIAFDKPPRTERNDLGMLSDLFRRIACQILIVREPILPQENNASTGHVIEPSAHI